MSAEYTYYIGSEVADDPVKLTNITTLVVTIVNSGDLTGTDLGFYLKVASNDGPFDYPSTDSPATNLADIIAQGLADYGITITQGLIETRFEPGVGDSYETRIPLTVGTGTNTDEIAAGATIDITLELSFASGTDSKNFYVDLVIA